MRANTAHARPSLLPTVGEVLDGRFEVLGVLGDGGMGYVFRVRDRQRGREVALKLLTPRYLGRPEREQRFFREVELGTRAEHHRHLIDYLEGGRLRRQGWPFLVTELVPGRDLAGLLARGPLETPLAVRMARQIAGAVLALHRAGIVHRDVTSMNVLVSDGDAVLIDLSHAGEVAAPQHAAGPRRLTRKNEVPGTHHYMPPEQARAEPAHPAMDVYAFGVMLVHMLTGVAPGGCGRDAFIELQREGRLQPPRIDTRVYTEVPLALAELVDACTGADPKRRPTMEEIVWRLDELLVVMAASVAEPIEPVPAANGAGHEVTAPSPVASDDGGQSRQRSTWVLAGIAAVALAAMAAVTASLSTPEPVAVAAERPAEEDELAQPKTTPTVALAAETGAPRGREPEAREVSAPTPEPPTLEPAPTPAPSAEAPAAEPSEEPAARAPRRHRRAHSKSSHERAGAKPCEQVRAQATEARRQRRWSQLVQLTRSTTCWDDANARAKLRVKALSALARYGECVTVGKSSSDPEVERLAKHCAKMVARETP